MPNSCPSGRLFDARKGSGVSGTNNHRRQEKQMSERWLVQDIETIPESEVASDWKPTEEEIRKANGDPFPPLWADKVLTIGVVVLDERLIVKKTGCCAGGLSSGATEKAMVERWSDIASGRFFRKEDSLNTVQPLKLVDFNGARFDVPVLTYRAFHYGIDLGWYFGRIPDNRGEISSFSKTYRDRYHGEHHDLAELFTNFGRFNRPHLKTLAKLMGLPGKTGMDGSQTYQAFKDGKFKEIDSYCMEDVYQTAWIFMRYLLMAGKIGLETYQVAASSLLDVVRQKNEHVEFFDKIDVPALLLQ
jgi:predicted PolB exonuclease-like 3'-5' exonuclease